jgi:tetratricopeptide (TPR) repeat protein
MLEGQALFQLGRYRRGAGADQDSHRHVPRARPETAENWLLLLRVIYFEQKEYELMIDVVKELVRYYPKDTYVLTLAGIYSELGDTKKQLALTEVLYERGMLTPPRTSPTWPTSTCSTACPTRPPRCWKKRWNEHRRVQRAQPEAAFAGLVPGARRQEGDSAAGTRRQAVQ